MAGRATAVGRTLRHLRDCAEPRTPWADPEARARASSSNSPWRRLEEVG